MSALRRHPFALALAALAMLSAGVAAWAFFSATGSGSALAAVGSLQPAQISAPSTSTGSTTIAWTQQASVAPALNSAITYTVQRRLGSGSYGAIPTGGCAGALPHGTASCTDTVTVSGSYTYRVVATYHTWTAISDEAGPVVTNTDTTPPAVQMIIRHGASPTNAAAVQFDVIFSEAVSGVDATDFALAASGVTGASIASVSGGGAGYSVVVNTGAGSGTLGLNLVDDDSIADLAGNALGGPGTIGPGDGSFTGQLYAIDRSAPSVLAVSRADADPTSAATLHWTVTFSESVSGVDATDFALAASGAVSDASITAVSGVGASYTVTASSGTGSGSLGLNVVDDDSVADPAANPLGGTGAGNGNFTGQVYAIDRSAPSVTVEQKVGQGDPTNAVPMQWTVAFSEPVTGFDAGDLVRGGTTTGGTVAVTGSGASYEIALSGTPTNGTTTFSIAAGAAQDAVGNASLASTSADNSITYDTVAPAVTLTTPANGAATNSVTPSLSGAAGNATGDGTTVTVRIYSGAGTGGTLLQTLTPARTGASWSTVAATLAQGTYTAQAAQSDSAGNVGTSSANTFAVDTTAPTVTVNQKAGQADPTATLPILWTVAFSEPVTGFDAGDLTRSGTSTGGTVAVTGGGASYEISLSGTPTAGTVTFTIVASRAQDAAGNGNAASTSTDNTVNYTGDSVPPQLVSLQMLDQNTNGKVDRIVATFNETLQASTATAPWTLSGVPSNGTLASVSTSGTVATLVLSEGAGAHDTAVGSFTVALAASAAGIRDAAGNQASFAGTAPADGAAPVLVGVATTPGTTPGRMESGDTLALTFSEALNTATVAPSYTVTESRSGTSSLSAPSLINNASIDNGYLGGNNSSGSAAATSSLSLGNTRVTVTLGTIAITGSGVGTGTAGVAVTASNVLKDSAGNGAIGSLSVTPLF